MQAVLGEAASASRSQSFYLDITHPMANKGTGVRRLAALMGVPMGEVAVIGDSHNDVGMFAQSGLSIAMGNAPPDVKKRARFVTGSNDQDGLCRSHPEVHPRRMTQPLLEVLADADALARRAADSCPPQRAQRMAHSPSPCRAARHRSVSTSCSPRWPSPGHGHTGSGGTSASCRPTIRRAITG